MVSFPFSSVSVAQQRYLCSLVFWTVRSPYRIHLFVFFNHSIYPPAQEGNLFGQTDLGYYTVKFRSDEISFTAMGNLRELHTIFLKLVEEGKIHKSNLENKAAKEKWAKAFRPMIVACIVLSIPVFFIWIRYLGNLSFYLGFLSLLVLELSMCFAVDTAFQWYYEKRMK